jgi:hypothetical protein
MIGGSQDPPTLVPGPSSSPLHGRPCPNPKFPPGENEVRPFSSKPCRPIDLAAPQFGVEAGRHPPVPLHPVRLTLEKQVTQESKRVRTMVRLRPDLRLASCRALKTAQPGRARQRVTTSTIDHAFWPSPSPRIRACVAGSILDPTLDHESGEISTSLISLACRGR